jgi:hypothetical protein
MLKEVVFGVRVMVVTNSPPSGGEVVLLALILRTTVGLIRVVMVNEDPETRKTLSLIEIRTWFVLPP